MKKVGIFGGSFNPPTKDHINLGIIVKAVMKLDEIWYLPSFNPLKDPAKYVSPEHRLEMLRIAISQTEYNEGLVICEKDISRNRPSYMIDTLRELQSEFPDTKFSLIIGMDCLYNLVDWKDWRSLVRDFDILVIPRRGLPFPKQWVDFVNIRCLEFINSSNSSSTELRHMAWIRSQGHEISEVRFPKGVLDYIIKNKLYENEY